MTQALELDKVSFAYGAEQILEEVSFEVGPKDFVGIIGPNGAGKTTLIKLILGVLKPQAGSLSLFGKKGTAARSRIGYVPQDKALDPQFPITALEVVLSGLLSSARIFHPYQSRDYDRAREVLSEVGLADKAGERMGDLSGGQRQRVFLARALAAEAELFILDEPLTSVDLPRGLEFYALLKKLNEKSAIVLVSHDVGVIPNYVNRILCLNRKVFHYDSKEQALENLEHVYGCSIDLVAHGVPHRVLKEHKHA